MFEIVCTRAACMAVVHCEIAEIVIAVQRTIEIRHANICEVEQSVRFRGLSWQCCNLVFEYRRWVSARVERERPGSVKLDMVPRQGHLEKSIQRQSNETQQSMYRWLTRNGWRRFGTLIHRGRVSLALLKEKPMSLFLLGALLLRALLPLCL